MNTQQRFKIYLVLVLLTGVGLALTVPALAQAYASTSSDHLSSAAAEKIIYVDKNNTSGTTNGESWASAYTDLQAALTDADSGDEIWVATGVYIPGIDRSDTFQLVEGVAVYGGFNPAAGADQFGERDWQAYPTILSGDIGGDDTNTNGVVLTTTHIVGDNSYHVVTADGTSTPITGTTLLDGFTITAGQANNVGVVPDNRGGGYYCDGSGSGGECSPSLRNVTFSGDYAEYGGALYNNGPSGTSHPSLSYVTFSGNQAGGSGGAMFNNGVDGDSSPSMVNVIFSGNSAGLYGGAMRNYGQNGDSHPSLRDVTFSGNHAEYGGAMANHGSLGASSPSLDNVNFSGNSAGTDGGAMYNRAASGTSSPTLTNVTFSSNSADAYGGAMCNDGEEGTSSPNLSDVTFVGNTADINGGAMYNNGYDGTSSPSLSDVTFSSNSADWGGAMYNDGYKGTSSPSLSDVTFVGNTAVWLGGAMYNIGKEGNSSPSLGDVIFSGNSADSGGAMYNNGYRGTSSPSLANVTFSGNHADSGGAMYNRGSQGTSSPSLSNVTFSGNSADTKGGAMFNLTSSPSLSNLILWGNTAVISGSQLFNSVAIVTITTSLVQGGLTGSGVYNHNSPVTDGGGNLDDNPDFERDPDPGDGDWTTLGDNDYGDLRLQPGSPAIDTGTNSAISLLTDLDGNPRVVDGDLDGTATVDMGAYELQTYPLDVSLAGSGSGTVSGDGISCAAGSAGADCTETYPNGTIVTLTASTDPGSTFTGWGGACNHTSSDCVITITGTQSVTATFTLNQYPLSVSLAGPGGGSVSSAPPGIDCAAGSAGADCTESYDYGSLVSLSAAADSLSTFSGWGGACAGTGGCTLTMTEALSVTAVFDARFVYVPIILR